jgi:ribosomal protein S4
VTSTAHQIDELQKAVEISKSKFDSCVERLRTKVLLDIHSKSSENLRESKGIRQAQHATILRLEESMSAVQSDLEDSRKQFAARFDEAERLQAQNSAYILLQDAFRCGKLLGKYNLTWT